MSSADRKLPKISFEFFPPKSPRASMNLWTAVERLAPLGPDFVSVTYGAAGTTRDRFRSSVSEPTGTGKRRATRVAYLR